MKRVQTTRDYMIELKQIFYYLCITFHMFKRTTQNMPYCTTFPRYLGKKQPIKNFTSHTVSVFMNLNYSLAEDYVFNQLITVP